MIRVEEEWIGQIPVLHVGGQSVFEEELPLVIFIHGFQSAKEHNLHYAYLMAKKGFRVILPDVLFHGERTEGHSDAELMPRFWEMVLQTIQELSVIKDDLLARKLIDPTRIGIAGSSMGGIVTNGALATHDWLAAGVSLMGNPSYVAFAELQVGEIKKRGMEFPLTDEEVEQSIAQLKPYDLSLNRDKLANRPLMFWHGAKDHIVPYQYAYRFYEEVKTSYTEEDDNKVKFILDKRAAHKVSRDGVLQTVEWFDKHLMPTTQKA